MTIRAGDTQTAILVITDASGAVVTTAVIGDLTITARFNAASHTLGGTALTHLGSGVYQFTYTGPSTAGSLAGRLSHATWTISPDGFTDTVEVYDLDAIAALATTTATLTASAIVLQEVDLGQVVVGDSWRSAVLTVSQTLLDAWGLSNLSGYTGKLSAAVRTGPTDTDQDVVTVTEVDLAATSPWPAGSLNSRSTWTCNWSIPPPPPHPRSSRWAAIP